MAARSSLRLIGTLLLPTALAAVAALASVLASSDVVTGESDTAGLASVNNQLWHQDTPGVEGAIDGGEEFGTSLAIGDFNNDGIGDLAIGVPEENVAGHANAGAVNVLYGTEDGLRADNDQLWTQESFAIGAAAAFDSFGEALTTGDFDDDGYSDLVIGVPGKAIGDLDNAGVAHVLYGSEDGLTLDGNQLLHQDAGLEGLASAGDDFGAAFAVGDFNGDAEDDLAIGVPGEEIIFAGDEVGGVNVMYGSASGLTTDGNQLWTQATPNIEGLAEDGDEFGMALTAGDFNGDGEDDLAIGAPGESVSEADRAGATGVIYGGPTGLTAAGDQIIHQDITGVPGVPQMNDILGSAVTRGDFNNDGYDDLAIGIPGESVNDEASAGTVLVVLGSDTGLDLDESINYTKTPPLIAASDGPSGQFDITENDRFGSTLAAADFNGDGEDDLAAGAPGHDTGKLNAAGAVHVFFGSSSGLAQDARQFWQAGVDGILGEPGPGANFGDALAAGDLNGGGLADLAIGAQDSDVDDIVNAGTVHVLYSDIEVATPTNTPVPATSTPTDTPVPDPTDTPAPTDTPEPGATATPPPGVVIGDVDCSGAVNAIDAAFLLQLTAALIGSVPCPENGDVNEDGTTNTLDAALILQFSAGLLGSLPP